jgi:hypothetical protein
MVFLGVALVGFALSGCVTGGGGGDSSPILGTHFETATYSVSGDTLTIHRDYLGYFCTSDSPSVAMPDSETFEDQYSYEITGNQWMDWNQTVDSLLDPEDTSLFPVVVAAVQTGNLYVREGSGTGRNGTWRLVSKHHYRVVFGTVPSGYDYAGDEAIWAKVYSYKHEYRQVSGDTIRYWRNDQTAAAFIAMWNGDFAAASNPDYNRAFADSANYDITVSKVDQYTVKLKGRTTGETVLRHRDDLGVTTYSSDDPGHATFVYDPNAVPDCNSGGSGFEPEWYGEFLSDNTPVVLEEEMTGKRAAKADRVRATLRETDRFEKLFSNRRHP